MLAKLPLADSAFHAPFRFRELPAQRAGAAAGRRVVVTGLTGGHAVLSGDEFARFAAGEVSAPSPLYTRLCEAGVLRAELAPAEVSRELRERRTFLNYGPNLHILVVTLRCNETCVYCHASRRVMTATDTDMSREVAERAVDLALSTTSPSVTLEFQGGEPLAHFERLKHVVSYALERNRSYGKQLGFSLVSNLSLMDEAKLAWLLERRVQVCTSIDGPERLHDAQRRLAGASAYSETARWIRRINDAYRAEGLDPDVYHVEALLTTTRETLSQAREVIDTYVELGCRALFLRPLNPFGFAGKSPERLAYSTEEFLDFYARALDLMLALNAEGTQILERTAALFLTKILGRAEPNYLDLRNPCGAGIGQVTYNHDGAIFTCDEGRMLHEEGDDTFRIGDVATSRLRELMLHETVRSMAVASNLDAQPDCESCAYNPYCGVCPVFNHKTQGGIFGRMRGSSWCAVRKGVQDLLFHKLAEGEPGVLETFRKWTTVRGREHFLHEGS